MRRLNTKLILILLLVALSLALFGCGDPKTIKFIFLGQGYEIEFDDLQENLSEDNSLIVSSEKSDKIKFAVIIKDGYKSTNLIVTANGEVVEKDLNNKYTLEKVKQDIGIEVSGIEKISKPENPDNPDNPSDGDGDDSNKPEVPDKPIDPEKPPVEVYYNVKFSEESCYEIESETKDKILEGSELNFDVKINSEFSARDMKVFHNKTVLEPTEIKDDTYSFVATNIVGDVEILVADIKAIANVNFGEVKGATINAAENNDKLLVGDEYSFTLKIDKGYNGEGLEARIENINIPYKFKEEEELYYFSFKIENKNSMISINGIKLKLTIEFPKSTEYYIVEECNLIKKKNGDCAGIYEFVFGQDISFSVNQVTDRKITVNINGIPYSEERFSSDIFSTKIYLLSGVTENIVVTISIEKKEIIVQKPSLEDQANGNYVFVDIDSSAPKEGEHYNFCIDFKTQNALYNEVYVKYGSENLALIRAIRTDGNTYYYETEELFNKIVITVEINGAVEIEFAADENIIVKNAKDNENILSKSFIRKDQDFSFVLTEKISKNKEISVMISYDNGATYSEIIKNALGYTIKAFELSITDIVTVKINYLPDEEETEYSFTFTNDSYYLKFINADSTTVSLVAGETYKFTSNELSFTIYESYGKIISIKTALTPNFLTMKIGGNPRAFSGTTPSDFYVNSENTVFSLNNITGDIELKLA